MKRTALAWLFLACVATAPGVRAEEKLVDGIAAQVGSDVVLVSEVLLMAEPAEKAMREKGAPESEIAKLRADALERVIEWRLIEQVVRKSELYASDEEIDQTIEAIAGENKLTPEQLRASVESHGMSYDDYREQIKQEIERRKVVQAMVASRVRVEDDEVEKLYAQRFSEQPEGGNAVHVRQILVTYGKQVGRDSATACQMASAARDRIAGGESFESVASQVSEVAPQRGGDIGWIHEEDLASWMASVLNALPEGGSSDVVELPFGCTVLQLVERKVFTPITFEEAKPRLRQELFEQRMDEAYQEWMETLRENTYIERKGHFADASTFSGPIDGPGSGALLQ